MRVFSHFAVASLPLNTARHLGHHGRPGLGEGVGSGAAGLGWFSSSPAMEEQR